ncbi:nitrite reductase small subunit NirD [Lysobacter sp. BMK333-48F3]|uniref:nitrite reductase small subunit NirD n=1 Tax=Lysobacter sp. BMK333-48F3 TaxID=2867962 RepID=UPI001C8C1272|nr:nitrite reductase small subunit NirD [Lysobacter sp. BMK333-48F3]MBX9403055.1 nitrite reductase small subunit NirD [Lysobacter sp. BMK333-48F3]
MHEIDDDPRWQRICVLEDIPRLGARVLEIAGGDDVAVFRTADDRVFALIDRCPHKGGPLSQGLVAGDRVTCPLHAWTIGLGDGRACEPDVGCTPTLRVRLQAGEVWLALADLPLRGAA